MMDDKAAAEVFQPFGRRPTMSAAAEVVAHYFDAEIATGLDDALNGFRVGPSITTTCVAPGLDIISASSHPPSMVFKSATIGTLQEIPCRSAERHSCLRQ